VLDEVDLRVPANTVLAVTGPSGAGKTTLLNALLDTLPAGLRRIGGEVGWAGMPVPPGRDAARFRRTAVALLGQDPASALNPLWTVARLVAEPLTGLRAASEIAALVEQALAEAGLDPARVRHSRPHQLSGGQAQRVALARALVTAAPLLLLDEPTSSLDAATARQVVDLVRRRRDTRTGSTVLISHDRDLVGELADQVIRLGVEPATAAHRWTAPARPPAPPAAPVLAATGLDIEQPSGTPLLRAVTVDLRGGELIALHGRSGSGKTTLVRALAGLHPPRAGQLVLGHRRLPHSVAERDREQLRAVQYLPQNPLAALHPAHRIRSAVARPARILRGLSRRDALTAADELLAAVGLDRSLWHRRPAELSGGQRQRVLLARALAAGPRVLLADEPTSALDDQTCESVLALLLECRDEGLAVLIATHDPRVTRVADRVLRVCVGPLPHRLDTRPAPLFPVQPNENEGGAALCPTTR
jgi:peptide/nickel transport system ATP-binding protein